MTTDIVQPTSDEPLPPITPKMRSIAHDVLRKAKVQLAMNHPFYGSIALKRPVRVTDEDVIHLGGGHSQKFTACVDIRGNITIGVRFLSELRVQQCVFLLAHEASHYMFMHGLRRGSRDPREWNKWCDAVINDLLIENKVGEFIDGGVNMPGSHTSSVENLYQPPPPGDGSGGSYKPGSGFDDLDTSGMDDAQVREIEQQVKIEMAQAAQAAKMQGATPVGMEKIIEEIINPPTPWYKLLEPFMENFIKSDYSWARPNKRMMAATGIYLPSAGTVPRMGAVVIARDSSGSCMDMATQAHFLGHINSILERCAPEIAYVIDCDCAVEQVKEYTPDDLPIAPGTANPIGGGGTTFAPPFDYVREQGIEPDCFIYLTDMYGTMPTEDPGYPVVWLSTSTVEEAPFGTVIKYDVQ